MNKKTQITFDRCQRVLAFLDDHDGIWAADDPVRSITSSLTDVSRRLAETSTRHLLLEQQIRKATREKSAALQRLKPRVRNLIRLAQTFPNESFGFEKMTYYHGKLRVGIWIDLARSLVEEFGSREAELVGHGAQPGVLDGVRESLEIIERATAKQEEARMERLRVTRELGAIRLEARGWFRRLHAIMRLRFEEDWVRLSQWQRANRDHLLSRGEAEDETGIDQPEEFAVAQVISGSSSKPPGAGDPFSSSGTGMTDLRFARNDGARGMLIPGGPERFPLAVRYGGEPEPIADRWDQIESDIYQPLPRDDARLGHAWQMQ